jgi:hypothetical protein
MIVLGYYAKDKNNDLFQFEWSELERFYIIKDGIKITANSEEFEIIQIGVVTADD